MARLLNREQKRDFKPRIQVVIEVERPTIVVAADGSFTRTGGKLISLDTESLTDASVNTSLLRPPDGKFTVANPQDKWFNTARKLSQITGRQKEVSDYLLQVLQISTLAERNEKRRELFWERLRTGKLTLKALREATIFGEQRENGKFLPGEPPSSREDAYAFYEYFSP